MSSWADRSNDSGRDLLFGRYSFSALLPSRSQLSGWFLPRQGRSIWSERAMNPRQQASQSQMHISFSKCQNGKPPSVFSEFKLEMYSNDEGRQRNATTQKRRRWDRIQFQRWIIYRLGAESGNVIEVGVFWLQKLRLIGRLWTDVAKFLGDLWPRVKLKVYQISANLIHRELRNATCEGEKCHYIYPDSAN